MEKTNETPADSASATVQGTKITIGDLEYDAQQQTLRNGELFASLTLCESKIVAYLSRNPGRHISSDELLRIALGSKARQKTTVVERHICSIRKKIATIKAETTIQTVRQKGYILKES
jgi:DNA-binding response OmpR family regulator